MLSLLKFVAIPLLLSTLVAHAAVIGDARLAAVAKQEEQALNARIGIAVIDTASEEKASYRGNERFPLNSTHKALRCYMNRIKGG